MPHLKRLRPGKLSIPQNALHWSGQICLHTTNSQKSMFYMHVNAKMIPVETVPGIRGGGMGENRGDGEFRYDIFDTL
jgi:hypothetical protein